MKLSTTEDAEDAKEKPRGSEAILKCSWNDAKHDASNKTRASDGSRKIRVNLSA
jgi:hypothetical protein